MNETAQELKVVYQGADLVPPKPRVTVWSWVVYFVYNLVRKPKVWKAKREQDKIYNDIKKALHPEFLDKLVRLRGTCTNCRNTYGALLGQNYISLIQMVIRNMRCEDHHEHYDQFLKDHLQEFNRNESLAAYINGFKR